MLFQLRNIGLIESIDLELDGLTVIAGHNNIGKSYIGKTLFCVVKAFGEVDIDENVARNEVIQVWKDLILNYPDESKDFFDNKDYTRKNLNQLKQLLSEKYGEIRWSEFSESNNFNYLLNNIFHSDFHSKGAKNPCSIIWEDNSIEYFSYTYANGKKSDTTWDVLPSPLPLNDASLIESPVVLELSSFLRDRLAFSSNKNRSLLPYHTYDLIKKIILGRRAIPNGDLYQKISKIINGQVHFSEGRDNFVFTDQQKNSFDITNVASGIKSFGLIQLLIAADAINPSSLLVIDEPEVHLHPEWQLEYAKLLVALVKNNVPVLVASHSPYFVEALKVYSDKESIGDKTNFYLGEKGETGTVFNNVTQNLDLLFEKFSAPMIKLMIDR